jgi:excinuclease ABC subunit B
MGDRSTEQCRYELYSIKLNYKVVFVHRDSAVNKAARVREQSLLLRERAFGAAAHDSNVIPLTGNKP